MALNLSSEYRYEQLGVPLTQASTVLVWGHGWGHDRNAFRAFCSSLPQYAHIILDFPGFGEAPPPPSDWGTEHYADAAASLLQQIAADKKILWIGHSFGGRVGIQLGARYPRLLAGLCLIASAGLKRHRSFAETFVLKSRIYAFKMGRYLANHFPFLAGLQYNLGSSEYQKAGVLRPVFVRVVNEDLTDVAKKIACSTLLIYGEKDTETPPEIGQRLCKLIPRAEFITLPALDHYSVLGEGRHIVIKRLQQFMDRL